MDEGLRQIEHGDVTVKKGRLLGTLVGRFSFLTTYAFTTSYRHAESLLQRFRSESIARASGSLVSVQVRMNILMNTSLSSPTLLCCSAT